MSVTRASTEQGGRPAVREVPLPEDARAVSRLRSLDYTDAFLLECCGDDLTAEQWARSMLEGAPRRFRLLAPLMWRVLGLERGPVSSAHSVLTWPIRQRSVDVVLLGARGRLGMSAELLLERRPEGLLFATLVEQRSWLSRVAWAALEVRHRRIVADLLRSAGRRQALLGAAPAVEEAPSPPGCQG